jgi:hypothetical protein
MKKIIFKDSGEITAVISGSEEDLIKYNISSNSIYILEDIDVDVVYDKVIQGKLVKEEESNKNVLDKLFLTENNKIENIPLNTELFIDEEPYGRITDGFITIIKDYPEQIIKLTFKLWPHKTKVIYA